MLKKLEMHLMVLELLEVYGVHTMDYQSAKR